MSKLNKFIRVERSVNVYRELDDKLLSEIRVNLPIEELKKMVPPKADDPELYDGYLLSRKQIQELDTYLDRKIVINHKSYYYVLECTGIYKEI